MREGKRYLSLFLAAAITVTGVNAGTAFQVNAANNDAASVAEWRATSPGIGSPDDGVSGGDGQEKVDKTKLAAKIVEAEKLKKEDYTAATWPAFETALKAAQTVNGNQNATQTDVNTALTNLTNAMAGLKKVTPDDGQEVNKTALKTKIDEVKNAQATYTPASWDAFKPALTAAEAVLAKADATQKEVDDALTALNTAIDKLVKVANKTELKKSIDAANKLNKADYTPASWTKLQTALTTANTVYANANATQAQVDQARTSLTTAIGALVKVANKAELKKSIDAANKLKKADYTTTTWNKFDAALKEAKSVYSNVNATQAQVDAAKKKLDDAKKALKKKVIKVTKVTITNGKALKIAAGKKVTLKTSVTPKNASNKKVKWSISKKDKKYATVSAKGVVTTKKAGAGKTVTVTATATDGSKKKATVKISIMKNVVTKVTLKAKSKTLKVGKKVTVKATVKTNGKKANKKLAWKSSNTKYATVNSKGVVTAKKAGKGKTVTITATATDGSGKKGTIKIKIKK